MHCTNLSHSCGPLEITWRAKLVSSNSPLLIVRKSAVDPAAVCSTAARIYSALLPLKAYSRLLVRQPLLRGHYRLCTLSNRLSRLCVQERNLHQK